jgi:site-specific DNA-methyltransferase (adenine-specific)
LKDNGTLFIYGYSETLAYLCVRIPINKRWLIWHYTNKNSVANKFWQHSHESILCCWKNSYIFNKDAVREPYTPGFLNGVAGKSRPPTRGRFNPKKTQTVYNAHEHGALPRDVIKIPALSGRYGQKERVNHPTQKPLAFCEKLILSAKQADGYVLVPFAGSGSECVAAKNTGLDFIGFEINPEYVAIAHERLNVCIQQ